MNPANGEPATPSFDAFLEAAWNDHGDRPGEVADRLDASLHLVSAPEHVAPYARLATHVCGEHLGQWQRGIALLGALGRVRAFDGSSASAGAIARGIATLRHASGDSAAIDELAFEDRVSVLAAVSATCAGRGDLGRAAAIYREALGLAADRLPDASPACRALAVAGNNLAAALEEKPDRTADESEAMVTAAESGLRYWKLAGTWLEEERAEYRLARSLLQAGRPEAAARAARRCLEICRCNEAPALEYFFGQAALALTQRAAGDGTAFAATREAALGSFARVPAEEQRWCTSELAALGEPGD